MASGRGFMGEEIKVKINTYSFFFLIVIVNNKKFAMVYSPKESIGIF